MQPFMQSASTGDQTKRCPTGAGIANHWSTRQTSAPTDHQLQSVQKGMASDPRIPARNTKTMMAGANMGPSAGLHTNVSRVVDLILTPDALKKEKRKQEITGANCPRIGACSCMHSSYNCRQIYKDSTS